MEVSTAGRRIHLESGVLLALRLYLNERKFIKNTYRVLSRLQLVVMSTLLPVFYEAVK